MDTIDEPVEPVILEAISPEATAEERARKPMRGRPRGRASSRKTKVDKAAFAQQLVGIHQLVAVITQQPIIAIESEEGKQLASAIGDIVEEYGFTASRRAILWGNLVTVASIVYVPKFLLLRQQMASRPKKVEQAAKPETPAPQGFKMDFSSL